MQCAGTVDLRFVFLELLSFVKFIFQACPAYNSQTDRAINLKLHRWIYFNEGKCSAQKPLLCISYFLNYCPLLIFILQACPAYNYQTISAVNLKLQRWIDIIEERCSAQEPLLCISYFWSYFHISSLSAL